MTPDAEINLRTSAALERLGQAQPAAALVYMALTCGGMCLRLLVHACLGFAVATTAGISLWWGPPLALASVQTLGRVWSWSRRSVRSRRAEALERMADAAEAKGGEK